MNRKLITGTFITVLLILAISACNKTTQTDTEVPTVSLMVWDEKAKEGSDFAELQLFQVGEYTPNLTVYFTFSGTAKNGYDYNPILDTLIIKNRTSLKIRAIDDIELEGDETIKITLVDHPSYNIDPEHGMATFIIQDNELPDVQFSRPSSGNDESSKANIEVTLSKAVSWDVVVNFEVSGIMAENDADYKSSSETLVFPAGSTVKTIALTIINDNIAEDDETVVIKLINSADANIGINEKHYYTIINDDGEAQRSSVYDKIYGVILGTRAGSSMGGIVELGLNIDQIEKIYGLYDEFIPYIHYGKTWSHPAGGTEDGVERQKLICTAIIEKQDRINAEDMAKIWLQDCEMDEMYYMTQAYDRTLLAYTKWGITPDELPKTKYGMPGDLGEHIHLTARVFHPIPCINAGDPEGAIEDMKEIGKLYYEDKEDDAFAWGAVYNAALALAMLPGATVNSVIEDALKYATPEIKEEIEYGLALADKYSDNPLDRKFREELNAMYADPNSPYCIDGRIEKYPLSSIYENVTCAFAIFKATQANVKDAVIIACNRARDTDCTAASAAGIAAALTGTSTIPQEWIDFLENGIRENPYTNNHMTNKAAAQGIYRALQSKLRRMNEEVKAWEDQNAGSEMPTEVENMKEYVELMQETGVI